MSDIQDQPANAERLTFRNYAKAHRHGTVIGQLPGGHSIPFGPYSLTQVGVFVGGVVVLYLTRALWMRLGVTVDIVVLLGVPFGLAMAERFVRPEGRSPLRSVAALAGYALAPRAGRRHGRVRPPVRRGLPRLPRRIFVRELAGPAPTPAGSSVSTTAAAFSGHGADISMAAPSPHRQPGPPARRRAAAPARPPSARPGVAASSQPEWPRDAPVGRPGTASLADLLPPTGATGREG